SVLVSYTGGILIERFRQEGNNRKAKAAMVVCVAVSLALLAFFKYVDFAVKTVNSLLDAGIGMLQLALPIGISFYTFQTISYMVDVYRGEAAAQKNLISYAAYVAMFPQLIAGPIVQYKTIDAQLRTRRETVEQVADGIRRFMVGLGKKVLLANNIGGLWETIGAVDPMELPVLTAWMGLAAYTLQIYLDFSAYSDMAIGLGHMFGFRFLENFNYPYISKSITEFWHRWHISLSTWFREYVYIPLGGNRTGLWRHIRNILVVWLLTGIWHGASWNFVFWGLYYGILLLAEKFIFGRYLTKLPALFQHIYCMFFVMIGWNLFAFDDMGNGIKFLKSLFGFYGQTFLNEDTVYLLYNHMVLLILCILGSTRLPKKAGKWIEKRLENRVVLQSATQNMFYAVVFLLSVAWLVDATFNPFLYFRF
ncbi:MAG: MBOAT family protein, partial [Lachnospiraceae bacterium]|nr:MBOAT family protein [Lachnospiraceae bacterium]